MDYSDFDFPPNPTDENDEHGAVPCLNNDIPLQALSSTPVEQLPPTTLPPNQQRPIRQAIQANQKLVMTARAQHRAVAVKKNEGDHDDREQKEEMDEDSEEEENAKKLFGWRKRSRFSWTEEELVDFYKFLSQYGTDFNAIAVLYTDKSRDEVKRLYHRELRRRPADVRAALASRTSIDLATFNTRLKKREEKRQQARSRKLDKEEEETLRQLEAGTLQLLPTSEGATDPGGTANADVEFSFDFKEESHAQKSDMVESLPLPAEGAVGEKEDDMGLVGSPENVLEGTEKTYADDFIIDW
ncbi:hypothetical protein, conserved [Trypanosoma brucei gambiense DAL972]|uniref:Transcription factor TFIIIB component B'' Myb domain-containing protein n=2 Tax=Trypanosoma brucei TaxID=5691 RepID=D0A3M5_TRYB9|nr:hypothetical protein, conserved [Trypanosoma brucei gambiense DAL972]RHW69744.1 hypothetical protein DPX39_100085500 [Trypanosoma brucei equiperdum]CBH15869.1 hypothetical protein, conserved [Trypanosoma brucei gambiense DAL972]|eukprot:XP_011778133.1 hypothetical protein, conserved [Trypanosoma brucei gambiense DAL972]